MIFGTNKDRDIGLLILNFQRFSFGLDYPVDWL